MIAISCSTRCFPADSLDRALVRVGWAGFDAAELAPPVGEPVPEAETLRPRLEAEELSVVAVDAGPVEAGTAEGTLEAMARVGRCAILASGLGATRVVLTAPSAEQGKMEHFVHGLQTLLGAIVELPVDLAVRHARGSMVSSPEAFTELYEQVRSHRLGLALDPAEATLAGWDLSRVVEEVPIRHLYLTDARDGGHVLFGTGDLEWEALAVSLVIQGYAGAASLLLEGADLVFAESEAREACAYAGEVFGRV